MGLMFDNVGRLTARYLQKPAERSEPFTPSDSNPVDVEIFADEIDAKVAARVFNGAYLSGARSAVVERDPRGWVVRIYQYAPVGYLARKPEAST